MVVLVSMHSMQHSQFSTLNHNQLPSCFHTWSITCYSIFSTSSNTKHIIPFSKYNFSKTKSNKIFN